MTDVLDIAVRHKLGDFTLDAAFTSDGRLTALFGSSGSGKTSLVNVIGGLIRPDSGHVRVDDETLVDTERGVFLPKHRRRIGYVFQEARLFPHLTVRQNLLFGHWFVPRAQRKPAELDKVLELLGIGHLLRRGHRLQAARQVCAAAAAAAGRQPSGVRCWKGWPAAGS